MTEAIDIADLKSLTDRINKRMDDRDEISVDIRDLFTLARSRGYNAKALRRVISDMRADPQKRKELEADLGLYRAALGMEGGDALVDPGVTKALEMRQSGMSFRDIEKATGVKRSVIHRLSRDSVGRDTESAAGSPSSNAGEATTHGLPQPAAEPASPSAAAIFAAMRA